MRRMSATIALIVGALALSGCVGDTDPASQVRAASEVAVCGDEIALLSGQDPGGVEDPGMEFGRHRNRRVERQRGLQHVEAFSEMAVDLVEASTRRRDTPAASARSG